MWTVIQVVLLVVGLGVLGLLIALVRQIRHTGDGSSHPHTADSMLEDAHREAAEVRRRAEESAADLETRAQAARAEAERAAETQRTEVRAQRLDLERRERRLTERESRLDLDARNLDKRGRDLDKRGRHLSESEAKLAAEKAKLADLEADRREVLERTARLTAEQAKSELVKLVENDAKRQAAILVRDLEREAHEEGEKRARKIIVGAIQRLATEQTAESVVSVLHLPSDDMKGRIIGREGRNIRTFEQVTGVNLIIDDTPEAVLLSCFDPVRREIARITLEQLVLDGRIHPHRIEEAYERSRGEVADLCIRAGEDALVETGLTDLHPELVRLLGTLRFRTSYGQNVLKHLVESAHIAAMLAAEIGLDTTLAKRCAFLHDIGKALTHQAEGSHARVGAEVARKYGEADDVVHAIEAHHNEVEPQTVEAVLTQAADAISGGRPGARRESLEVYIKRLERMEEIARSHPGVEKVFAMQAGREVRVMVLPDLVDDIQVQVLARGIAKQVEEELTYPGKIRITVVRESRATETAE
ncbi:ribonuclease Y [Actinopolymorpha alba]|uniref:ribonuclease Y n=1 Tax=Actinopolymorpha alba TaxID=533267 RepID=UPI0003688001|nr:ribonuclease Y [Actinopolymorpha alba]